jgi:hypothetical protein
VASSRVWAGIAALLVASTLVGCAAAATDPLPAETTPAAPPTEPTASAEPEPVASDVLFTLNAKVRSIDGRTIGIRMEGHQPVVFDNPEVADLTDQYVTACAEGTGRTPIDEAYLQRYGATLMRVDFISDTPGLEFASPIELWFGNPYMARAAVGGAVIQPPDIDNCFAGYAWAISDNAYGIASFESPSGVPDDTLWQLGNYGFSVLPDTNATIESCTATITDLGMASGLENVDGWDPSRAGTGVFCGIGYAGE